MADLQKFEACLCATSAGALVWKNKIMLVKHKKLGLWLLPGGHIDEDELPHKAAEREFWEETGIEVKAVSAYPTIAGEESEYLAVPMAVNLHWISKDNFERRIKSDNKGKRIKSKKFPKGCEQHYTFVYLVEPMGEVKYRQNVEETDGIGWFSEDEIEDMETTKDIKSEIKMVFKLIRARS